MISSNLTWIDGHAPELKGKTLVTLSMEGCIPELKGDAREANTKGGLGIYFGDKLEGLHNIGMDKAFGCMPLYKKRLIQSIRNGRQHIDYKDVCYNDQLIEHVLDGKGKPMRFDVWGWDRKNTTNELKYHVDVYEISRGGTRLYLFYCPEVFDILYSDDNTHEGYGREHRFLQETVFAECVYELLKSLNIVPDIIHLNEGHVAGAAAIIKGDKAFEKTSVVYTNHTVVPAGLEIYSVDRLTGGDIARARYAMRFPFGSHQGFWKKFAVKQDGRWYIDFSKGALEICDVANAVSNEHAYATQALFPAYDRTIESILNGSGDAWTMDELLEAKLTGVESARETLRIAGAKGKVLSLAEVKKRTVGMTDKNGRIISKDGVVLDPDLPTIWMVRRIVEYKSQFPVLKDIIHAICANRDEEVDTLWGKMNGLQMQVVLGGVTPEGSNEERWIEEFVGWMQRPDLRGRFVFVPNADTELLRMQAIGADICINCPLPQQEACGTSDQRSARNGGINIATRSGGPPEYIEDGRSGMLVGPYESKEDFYNRAPKDILDRLKMLSDMYYNQNNNRSLWLDMKMESYLVSPKVSAVAMEKRYADVYLQALRARKSTNEKIIRRFENVPNIVQIPELLLKLKEAAQDFLYEDPELKSWTVIAGSPYFDQRRGGQLYNWGRDTMIALPGLCLENKRFDIFTDIMKNYMGFVKNGLLPNLIGDGSMPRYNSIDASLWLLWSMGKYLGQTQDYGFLDAAVNRRFSQSRKDTVQDILDEIINTYRNGIQFEDSWREDGDIKRQTISIFMDNDYLISAGDENTQLTWMDVKPKGGRPVTSRHGKAVEINALWYNALKVMANIQRHKNSENTEYAQLAEKVKYSFRRFWNQQAGCLYDTIDGDPEQGRKIRPNQLFAVAFGLLNIDRSRAVMNIVRQELLTSIGLRTLSPHDCDYHAFHENEYSYHQGTVWPWLIGVFIDGSMITYGKQRTLRILDNVGYFAALSEVLKTHGSVPEVFDGACNSACDQINGKGCKSQAWNVAESLRGLSLLLSVNDLSQKWKKYVCSKIIYEMVVRDYFDAQDHVSGLIVASKELPFLAESGVEYVYLLGLMKHAGNPFDIMDPFDIDERAGSFKDLDNFISTAHKLGINVLVDWLANQHVSKKSPLSKAHPDWFLYTDALDGNYYIDKGMLLCTGRDKQTNEKDLVLVSATDEVPIKDFPRRWSSLAQPDLSHPDVRKHALDIGRFWLSKGLDGFRIDAALSTFPDKIKENWGLDVNDNLTRMFIEGMRKIKPDCFIMFEGFERLEELLQLADYENCAVYNWRPRNLTTDALREKAAIPALISYLEELEHMQLIRDQLISLGPEHDAFDFEDPWARLDYEDRLLMQFLYEFVPGYILVFNGQIFGEQHLYKIDVKKTSPAPKVSNADNRKKETGTRLFNLRRDYPQLIEGDYKVLNTGEQDVICLARFDESDIVIGVINLDSDAKEVVLSLGDIINGQLNPSHINSAHYSQDVLLLKNDVKNWISESQGQIPIKTLLREGLNVEIAPKSCQVIRLHQDYITKRVNKIYQISPAVCHDLHPSVTNAVY